MNLGSRGISDKQYAYQNRTSMCSFFWFAQFNSDVLSQHRRWMSTTGQDLDGQLDTLRGAGCADVEFDTGAVRVLQDIGGAAALEVVRRVVTRTHAPQTAAVAREALASWDE